MAIRAPEIYGIPISELARICRVSLKTAARWKAGTTCPPKSALLLLCADLGCFDKSWAGWRLQHGLLVSPEGWEIRLADVISVPILRQRLAAYQTELNRLQQAAKDKHIPDQPLPTEFPEWISEMRA
jgi:hypothetical protein